MDNDKPEKSEDQSENKEHVSTKRPIDNKPEGAKCNEEYFDELCRSPSPKRSKGIQHSNAYDQIPYTIQDKKYFADNIGFRNNPTGVRFDPSREVDPSHTSYLQEHKLHTLIPSDHEKLSHADRVVKRNSTKKEDVQEISFPHTADLFTIELENDSTYETLETEIKAFVELCSKDFVDETPGPESVVPVTSVGKDVATDWPLCKIFT